MAHYPIRVEGARPNESPYSPALDTGSLIFVSGQVPLELSTGALAGADFPTQVRRVLSNLVAHVEAAGLRPQDVAQVTVYMTNMSDFAEMNSAYREFFGEPYPARVTVGVSGLAKPEFSVEMDAVAVRSAARR